MTREQRPPPTAASDPIVSVRDLSKTFPLKRRAGQPARLLHAVRRVSFDIAHGETLGLVGESGSGKSTTGRMLVGLIPATSGTVRLFGETLTGPAVSAFRTSSRAASASASASPARWP